MWLGRHAKKQGAMTSHSALNYIDSFLGSLLVIYPNHKYVIL